MIAFNDDYGTKQEKKQEAKGESKQYKPMARKAVGKNTGTTRFEGNTRRYLRPKSRIERSSDNKSAQLPITAILRALVGRSKDRLVRIKQSSTKCYRNYQQNKADKLALYQLLHLNDYMLRDIGLTRSDLSAARQSTDALQKLVDKKILERRIKDNPNRSRK